MCEARACVLYMWVENVGKQLMSYILLTMWSKLLFDVFLFMLLMIEDSLFFLWNKWSCMFVELIDKVFRIIYFTFTKWNFFFCIDLSSLDIYIYIIFFLCNERVYINNWISLYAKISHSKCNERTAKSASWWLNFFFCSSRIDNKILSTPHVYSFLFWYELIWAKRIGKSSESFK